MSEQSERLTPGSDGRHFEDLTRWRTNVRSALFGETNSPMTPRRPRGCSGASPSTAAIPTPRY